jgi:hypothetical protein
MVTVSRTLQGLEQLTGCDEVNLETAPAKPVPSPPAEGN